MILTATNERVQAYLQSNTPPSTKAKKNRLDLFKQLIQTAGAFLSELFPCKQQNVLDEILYLTSGCGIAKIGADRLANRADVSPRTLSTTVNKLKQTGQFIVARINAGQAGKYIFIDKLHANFKEIMDVVFNTDATQLAYQVASLKKPKNVAITGSNDVISDSNYLSSFINTSPLICNSASLDKEAVQEIQQEIDETPVMNLEKQKQQLDQYATNEYQQLFFETMSLLPLHTDIEEQLYKLALRVGSDATIRHFHIAKSVTFELNMQLSQRTTTVKESTVALFNKLYQEALDKPSTLVKEVPGVSANVIFYDWLNEREVSDVQPPSIPNSNFFYNWLDERE